MAKGMALAIGLNSVDPQHYAGWSGPLTACEADANDMADIARASAMPVTTLLTRAATRAAVLTGIAAASQQLKKGDLFFLTYSGHGGQVRDLNDDEPDLEDETWCLFDGQLLDDELYAALGQFLDGVRVLVLSDSCHSGTVIKAAYYRGTLMTRGMTLVSEDPPKFRAMPPDAALATYRKNRQFYDDLQKKVRKDAISQVKASAVLISGCQDNQLSADGIFNGLFTGTLLRVWDDGRFVGDYHRLHDAIVERMPPDQTPNFFRVGPFDNTFEAMKPFTL